MIPKIPLCLVLIVAWINNVSGASFSKVYVQNGADVLPVEYLQYGTPGATYGTPHLAHLTAAPYSSVVPYSSGVVPCVAPYCVYPGQAVAPVAPVAPSANIVAVEAPVSNLPVVVASADPRGYEYAYVVYDQGTGDHKTQRELSDGSVVQGEYAFIQPDGYVREVKYTADELNGFNAVVKNYLPVAVEEKKVHGKESVIPCVETVHDHNHGHAHEAAHLTHEHAHTAHVHDHEPLIEEVAVHHEAAAEVVADHGHNSDEPAEPHATHEESNDVHAEHEPADEEVHVEHEAAHEVAHETAHEETHEVLEHHAEEQEVESREEAHDAVVETTFERLVELVPQEVQEVHTPPVVTPNVLVPYSDIIRCIEAAVRGTQGVPVHKTQSPLTYIVLNKPC